MGATISTAIISTANNVPTENPFVSQAGRLYYPMGNLSGAILPGNFDNLWLSGAGASAPMSNNFTDAVKKCTALCDTDSKCLSFNAFMVHEPDFNNGAPTWECRFSGNVYNPQDYTSNNGLDSFAWSVEAVPETANNMPTDNPYISQAGRPFYPIGDQKGHILGGNYKNLWLSGAGQAYPMSNNFTDALNKCSAECDTDYTCLSFNIFMVHENDFNNGAPAWECRFSGSLYNAQDYSSDNGLESFAWSMQVSNNTPSCIAQDNDNYNPQAWKDAGIDSWLWGFALEKNLLQTTDYFADKLMNLLGWTYYTCDTDVTTCSLDSNSHVKECTNWINIQIANYRTYLDSLVDVLNGIESKFQTVGNDIFTNLWWTGQYIVPQSNAFNPFGIIEDLAVSAAGLLPGAGPYLYAMGTLLLDTIPATSVEDANNNPSSPSSANFWSSIMTTYDQQFTNLGEAMITISNQTMRTPDLLAKVLQGGEWFIPHPQKPDPLKVWEDMVPYYASKIGMQAMAAQQVFFVAVPLDFRAILRNEGSNYAAGTVCTQDIADNAGVAFDLYSTYTKGTAFCDALSNQIIVPLIGFTPNPVIYTNYGNAASHLQNIISGYNNEFKIDNQAILQSSSNCKQAQPSPNGTMVLYYSEPLLSAGMDASNAASADCVWSIPVFQWSDWYPAMKKEYAPYPFVELKGTQAVDDQGVVHNFVSFLAYQLGFQDQISLDYDEYDSREYDSKTLKPSKWLTIVNQTDSAALSTTNAWGV